MLASLENGNIDGKGFSYEGNYVIRTLTKMLTDIQIGKLFNLTEAEVTSVGVVEELTGKVDPDVRILRMSEFEFVFNLII